ncbi:MAG: hypothetical protein QOJ72_2323 [Nocardioidaceae bacterium]|nr:hypothetical protein [Nocardioidaceae bacterium]
MTERDDFDKIVEGLDLDFEFPDEPADPVPADPPAAVDPPADDEVETEVPFYRQVSATPLIPRRGSTILAWFAVLGAPLLLVVWTMIGEILPRPMLAGAVLIFVAGAIYLISQLPEHGPSRSDWPDDGAVL